jgi:hypothetical protein
MDDAQPFGLDEAQVGVGIAGPSLRCSNFRAVGWVTDRFSFLGRNQLMTFLFSFLFSIFREKQKKISKWLKIKYD